jgi:hypothetical protein
MKAGADDSPEDLFRGRIPVDNSLRLLELREARGLPYHLGVETQLVSKVIVDRGNIGPGSDADLSYGGSLIAAVRKDAPCNVQQFIARGVRGRRPAAALDGFQSDLRAIPVHIQTQV